MTIKDSCNAILVFTLILAQPVLGATLKGRVLEERSGTALASASLRIWRSGSPTVAAEVETGADGRFDVPDLAEGDYRIEASKRSFVSSVAEVRLAASDGPGGQGVMLWLVRCGSISGRVARDAVEPVAGATVLAYPRPAEHEPLDRTSGQASSARVDANGEYRLSGLPPGEYLVAVSWSGSDIVRSRMRIAATTAARFGSGLVFYPGNGRAELVSISSGEERRNTDFIVSALGLQELSGRVEIPHPEARFNVALVLLSQPGVTISATQSGAEGIFRFAGIPAGSYEIIAVGPATRSGTAPLFARARVEVTGQGTESVTLAPRPGRSIAIQLAPTAVQFPPDCPPAVALTLTPASDWGAQHTHQVEVSKDRATAVANLAPDQYLVSARDLPEGCYIARGSVPDLREASASSPVFVPLAAGGSVSGRVIAAEHTASDAAVILVNSAVGARTRIAFPDRDGRYTFSRLPPGAYRIGARLLSGSSSGGAAEAQATWPVEVLGVGSVEVDLPVHGVESGASDVKGSVKERK
jgi:hypothetical protein